MRNSLIFIALLLALPGYSDSLFTQSAARSGTLIAEKLARFEVGDIITVIVREKITATTDADTNVKKESDVESSAPADQNTFLVGAEDTDEYGNTTRKGLNLIKPELLPNWQVEAENETKTKGTTRRSSSLDTQISCFVREVLPNGNIHIEGSRQVTVNREDSLLLISGVIRSKDVTPANTIQSTQIANATVQLRGKGPLWNNQRRGLFTRVLDWFSPF